MKKTCILFDIDGTLIDTRGAGRNVFVSVIREALNIDDDLNHISFAGATDLNILQSLCEKHGIPFHQELADTFFNLLTEGLQSVLHKDNITLLPGVDELLSALKNMPNMYLGLLTGNAGHCARIKLAPFDLNKYFPFGAYGDEFAIRTDIAHCARQRAIERIGSDLTRFIVVGDTPLDILAAHAIDAVSIVAATGKYNMNELTAAGADHIVPDLSNTQQIVDFICHD